MRKTMIFACIAMAALLGTCHGAVTFKADYKLRNEKQFPNGVVDGIVYYHYDSSNPLNSRVRFETTYNGNNVHTELYHYGNGALYNKCLICTASVLGSNPEQWGEIINSDSCDAVDGGYKRCQRQPLGTIGVVEFEVKGTFGQDDYIIRYIKFSDGREYELYNFETIAYKNYQAKFELQTTDNCPEPVCNSFMDVVFILDASGSVDANEWKQQKNFLLQAIKMFKIDADNARVGVIEFCGPTCCCKNGPPCKSSGTNSEVCGWYDFEDWLCPQDNMTVIDTVYISGVGRYKERRYAPDCAFDTKCKVQDGTNTAKVFMDLSSALNAEQVEKKISNNLEGDRIRGNTCQRYGLVKAYDMLFGDNNPRCSDQNNRTDCPIPVVIVITDGCDYCHESTKYWAEQIKNKDKRGILLEVGVGLEYEYDRNFLKELSSKIGGEDVSINVDSYSQVSSILDKVISPVCTIGQTSTSTCGALCKGYCACSTCFCPDCSDDAPNCKNYVCSAASPSSGCKEKNKTCDLDVTQYDPQCFNAYCSDEDGECKTDPVDCKAMKEAELGRELKECEVVNCSGSNNGCYVKRNHDYCKSLLVERVYGNCMVASCNPDEANDVEDPTSGCKFEEKKCNLDDFPGCTSATCSERDGNCIGHGCAGNCYYYTPDPDGGEDIMTPKCPPKPCKIVTCNEEAESDDYDKRCNEVDYPCEESDNKCMVRYCDVDAQGNNYCVEEFKDTLNCTKKNVAGGCRTWKCDPAADEGHGACAPVEQEHEYDSCIEYVCNEEDDMWEENPKCQTTKACKVSICDDGTCVEKDVDCTTKVDIPNKCFQAACREPDGCYKKQYYGAHFDVCGRCVSADGDDREESSSSSVSDEDCELTSEEDLPTEGLAAAAIALIVIGAIIIGAAVALSGVVGTKALIDRARGAANQSVVSNPLFEESQTEMTNPGFLGDA